jgi:TP901 family phage tail tape measure protein
MSIPVEQLIIKIAGDSKEFKKTIKEIQKQNKNAESSFKSFAKVGAASFTAVSAAATVLAKKAYSEFVQFEKGLTNVAKTTKLTGTDLDEFKDNIIGISESVPITTDRLLEIGTAAGQLGIQGTDNLTKFTKTIALLSETTNVEGEDAALTLARLINITGESVDTVDRLGAALVDLGNNFAAQESEILEISKDVGKAAVQFGLGSDEILGMSTAMAALGIQAEAGGTVVGKAFAAIDSAVRQGGPAFEKLIELTGMTGDELTETFSKDATKVFEKFIQGLGKSGAAGKDMTAELAAMELSGIRVNKILPTLATRSDLLSDALERAGKASEENTALNNEAAIKFESNAAKWQLAQNKINNTFIKLGAEIAPQITEAFGAIADTISENKGAITALVGATEKRACGHSGNISGRNSRRNGAD